MPPRRKTAIVAAAAAILALVASSGTWLALHGRGARGPSGPNTPTIGTDSGGLAINADGTFIPGKVKLDAKILRSATISAQLMQVSADGCLSFVNHSASGEVMLYADASATQELGRPKNPPFFTGEALNWFSPNGRHAAWLNGVQSSERGPVVLLLNGNQQGGKYFRIGAARFSADSAHFGFAARSGGVNSKTVVVVDGVEHEIVPQLAVEDLCISDDGRHVAATGLTFDALTQFKVWCDGKIWDGNYTRFLSGSLRFSPDGSKLAVIAATGNPANRGGVTPMMLVVNDAPWKPLESLLSEYYSDAPDPADGASPAITFSADSSHIVTIMRRGDQAFLLDNDTEIAQFNNIDSLHFSPDGRRTAFSAFVGAEPAGYMFMNLDGDEHSRGTGHRVLFLDGKSTRRNGFGTVYSADSRHVAYYAREPELNPARPGFPAPPRLSLIVDGNLRVAAAAAKFLQFSPDGSHTVLIEQDDRNPDPAFLVVDAVRLRFPLGGKILWLKFLANDRLQAVTAIGPEYRWLDIKLVPDLGSPAASEHPAIIDAGKPLNNPDVQRRADGVQQVAAAIADDGVRARIETLPAKIYANAGDKAAAFAAAKPDAPEKRCPLLVAIAVGQSRTDRAAAKKSLDEAYAQAEKIPNIRLRENSTTVSFLAAGYLIAGSAEGMNKALVLSDNLDRGIWKFARGQAVAELLAQKRFAEIYAFAAESTEPLFRQNTMARLASAADDAGDAKVAGDAYFQALTYPLVDPDGNGTLVRLCALHRPDEVIAAVADPRYRPGDTGYPFSFEKLAAALDAAGDRPAACKLLVTIRQKLIPARPGPSVRMLQEYVDLLLRIAATQIDLSDKAESAITLQQISAALATGPQFSGMAAREAENWAPGAKAALAALTAKDGQSESAAQSAALFKEAWQNAQGLSDRPYGYRTLASCAIIEEQIEAGDIDGAADALNSLPDEAGMQQIADRTEVRRRMSHAYQSQGAALLRKGDKTRGAEMFEKALQIVLNNRKSATDSPYGSIAAARAAAGDPQGAIDMLSATSDVIGYQSLIPIADAFADAGDITKAKHVAERAGPHNDNQQLMVLNAIAIRQFLHGDLNGAVETSPQAAVPGARGPNPATLLDEAAKTGKVDLVVKFLGTGDSRVALRLAKIRLDAGDKTGAQRILKRGIEAAIARSPGNDEDPWPLFDTLADAGAANDALAAAQTYTPKYDKYHPEPRGGYHRAIRPARIALLKARIGDIPGAIAAARKLPDPRATDTLLSQVAEVLAGFHAGEIIPTPSHSPFATTLP